MKTSTAAALATETVVLIPVDELHRSPTNPRKHNKEPDADFVDSIRQKGVLQPIIVRERKAGGFEVVFGDTRRRGSELAGKSHVPCIVRDMSDDEAYEAQAIENAHRRDLHPIDEADSFAGLLKRGRTPQDIAGKIGRPVAYILQRLKLCELSKKCREALDDGRLQLGVALQIARIPGHKLQDDALETVAPRSYGDITEVMSLKSATEEIRDRFMLKLVDAPFDRADPKLVPKAGACSVCPKRTGNQAELFSDVKSADLCTDPACFRSKLDAQWKVAQAAAKTGGAKVLSEKDCQGIFNGHGDDDTLRYGSKWTALSELAATVKKQLGDKLDPVLARNPRTGRIVEVVLKAVADGAKKKAAKTKAAPARTKVSPQEKARRELQALKADAQEARNAAIVRDAAASLVKLGPDQADNILLPLLLERLLDGVYGDVPEKLCERHGLQKPKGTVYGWTQKAILGLARGKLPAVSRGLLLELVLAELLENDDKVAFQTAKDLRIDVKKLEAAALAEVKAKKAAAGDGSKNGKPGVCRECGCTETTPCSNALGEACAWTDKTRTLCTACADKPAAKKKRPKPKPAKRKASKK
jgi:ParB/RepB/Spo0J family partition protein